MAKLRYWSDRYVLFQCPGCETTHHVRIEGPGPVWDWNQDMDRPTFVGSIIFNSQSDKARCHSTIQEGCITFDSDSKHKLAGQFSPLADWPEPEAEKSDSDSD